MKAIIYIFDSLYMPSKNLQYLLLYFTPFNIYIIEDLKWHKNTIINSQDRNTKFIYTSCQAIILFLCILVNYSCSFEHSPYIKSI